MEGHHESVLGLLKDCPCEAILHQLWYCIQADSILICSQLQGQTLQELMQDPRIHKRNIQRNVWLYLTQLCEATEFLHERNIIFLNWTAGAVVMSTRSEQVMLADFTQSLKLREENQEECLFTISRLLPPAILPPELLEEEDRLSVSVKSDIWGLVTLAYELSTGHMIRHEIRHVPRETALNDMKSSPVVSLDEIEDNDLKKVLRLGFRINPAQRVSLEKLKKEFCEKVRST
jgi:serine/threonine protein kinase